MSKTKRVFETVDRNIRRIDRVPVKADGTTGPKSAATLVGFEVRVGQTRAGALQPTLNDARKLRDRAKTQTEDGTYVAPSAGKGTVRAVVDLWLESDQLAEAKPTTAATYTSIALHRLAPLHDTAVNKITTATVREFRANLVRDGLAPLSVVKIMNVLSYVLDMAVDANMIPANPCDKVRRDRGGRGRSKAVVKKVVIPEMADVERLLAALADLDHPKAEEWSLYAEVAAYAGLRAGEICGLRVRNVNVLGRSVSVESNAVDVNCKIIIGTPKTLESRRTVTELDKALVKRLARQIAGREPGDFVFGDGKVPMRHKNFYRRVFVPTVKAAGLNDMTFHTLRHFAASDWLRDPHLSVKDVATRLGHADATLVLRTYGHLFSDAGAGLGKRVAARRTAARAKANRPKVVKISKATG